MRPGPLSDIFSAFESAESADRADPIDEYRDLAMLARAWENGSLEPKMAEDATGRVDDAEGEESALRSRGRILPLPVCSEEIVLMPTRVSLERVYEKVIFDMDGTLVDSRAAVEREWRRWALKHGVSADEILAVSHGRRTREIMRQFAPEGVDIDREASELEMRESDAREVCAVPGAVELLRWIPDADWAVVTSASRELALRRLSQAGLPLPKLLISAEDVTQGKPHPQGYSLAIDRMHARAGDCLVFEDAQAGILAAKAAGCDVVAITAACPHPFEADCLTAENFHCISFSLQSTTRPRRWLGRSPSAA